MLERFEEVRGCANGVSFSSCIAACERGSRWEACLLLDGDRMGLNGRITACGRALRWRLGEAFQVLSSQFCTCKVARS